MGSGSSVTKPGKMTTIQLIDDTWTETGRIDSPPDVARGETRCVPLKTFAMPLAYLLVCVTGSIQVHCFTYNELLWASIFSLVIACYMRDLDWKVDLLKQLPIFVSILLVSFKCKSNADILSVAIASIVSGLVRYWAKPSCLFRTSGTSHDGTGHTGVGHAADGTTRDGRTEYQADGVEGDATVPKPDWLYTMMVISCGVCSSAGVVVLSLMSSEWPTYMLAVYSVALLLQDWVMREPLSVSFTSMGISLYSLVFAFVIHDHRQTFERWHTDMLLGLCFVVLVVSIVVVSTKTTTMTIAYPIGGILLQSNGARLSVILSIPFFMTGFAYMLFLGKPDEREKTKAEYMDERQETGPLPDGAVGYGTVVPVSSSSSEAVPFASVNGSDSNEGAV